jgi:predicted RNA binding protein YcfA (HicA-like mRNA interferase family)
MCRVLEKRGWFMVRKRGSHRVYQKPGNPATVVVPVHGNTDLKPGTQRGIMKDAGLTEDDL